MQCGAYFRLQTTYFSVNYQVVFTYPSGCENYVQSAVNNPLLLFLVNLGHAKHKMIRKYPPT
jgi:hypothetical protein